MHPVIRTFTSCLAMLLAGSLLAQESAIPRTASGKPDLQGIFTNKTLTPLSRPRELGDIRALTPEQVARMESERQDYLNAEFADSDPERGAGVGAQAGNDGNTDDGYNEFWKDEGSFIQVINGEYRSSIVVDPANGQIPYKGDMRSRFRRAPGMPAPSDGPEGRPLAERCLLSFGSHSGPPMLPVMYNNNYQFIQTDDYVVILAEMVHDARIIRIDDELMPNMKKWMGDSVGHWDGDTLVVETAGFHPQQRIFGSDSDEMKITEEFSRISDSQILYRFTVEDETMFNSAWTGELMFNARPADEVMYEYACHEGNYALPGILAGARRLEQLEQQSAN